MNVKVNEEKNEICVISLEIFDSISVICSEFLVEKRVSVFASVKLDLPFNRLSHIVG